MVRHASIFPVEGQQHYRKLVGRYGHRIRDGDHGETQEA
jgi:hypothetical protein